LTGTRSAWFADSTCDRRTKLNSPPYPRSRWEILRRKLYKKLTLQKRRHAWAARRKLARALAELDKYPKNPNAPQHGLPGRLVISLTSYPARFPTLHLTLKSLLDQRIRPDKILLWIADEDADQLPAAVRELEGDRFEVRTCEDIRNFKKILPTLAAYPDAFILICDDDTYYPDDWLKRIVGAYDPAQPSIVCTRAHQLTYLPDGSVAPYRKWKRNWAHPSTARRATICFQRAMAACSIRPARYPRKPPTWTSSASSAPRRTTYGSSSCGGRPAGRSSALPALRANTSSGR
jgi:hypothetical protein